ncbi:hypothetical protein [Pelagibacterium sp.]|uniref:hypothetical protein n=1 Tax=Pelagibacterium sp. TaxID=1967288 RepID=UPI003A8F8AC9
MGDFFRSVSFILTTSAIILYLFLWLLCGKRSGIAKEGVTTWGFLWGAVFSASLYVFVAVGWYRYGFKKTLLLMLAFLFVVYAPGQIIDESDLFFVTKLVSISAHALGGILICQFDQRWRCSAMAQRCQSKASEKAAEDLTGANIERDKVC